MTYKKLQSPKKINKDHPILRGIYDALPITASMVPFGLFLGSQGFFKGMTPLEVGLMTGGNFAGGSELATINLWTNPPHILLIAGVTFLINCRHILMGVTFSSWLKPYPRHRVLMWLFLMSDESWGLSLIDCQKHKKFNLSYYLSTSWTMYIVWVSFTFLGALWGHSLGDLTHYGFDMAYPAVFLVLVRGMWKNHLMSIPWIVSLIVGVLIHLYIPGSWYIPGATLAGAACAWIIIKARLS